jgi:hypothetical protein
MKIIISQRVGRKRLDPGWYNAHFKGESHCGCIGSSVAEAMGGLVHSRKAAFDVQIEYRLGTPRQKR